MTVVETARLRGEPIRAPSYGAAWPGTAMPAS
jgi:hypothetical protein